MSRSEEIEEVYRKEASRVLATLIRLLGSFDEAEEALHVAFQVALEKWPVEGIPDNPYSWLVSTARFKSIDTMRKAQRGRELIGELTLEDDENFSADLEGPVVEDDQLRLIFYCCHPDLAVDSRVALALKEVCGVPTEEIANAYLLPYETVKKRISRAKATIREKQLCYEIPSKEHLPVRLESVRKVIYLIYNQGYNLSFSSVAQSLSQSRSLPHEAVGLARTLVALLPNAENYGLLALVLIQESRRDCRVDKEGAIVPLEKQDRLQWDQAMIIEGLELIQMAVLSGRLGNYSLQAAIASVHAVADSVENTQWDLIVGYYDMLLSINASPVVELNRAAAVGMCSGPIEAFNILERLKKDPRLTSYQPLYSMYAEFAKRLGKNEAAASAYRRAIDLARQDSEKEYLKQQLTNIMK